MMNYFLAAGTLAQRELVRFFRQRSRVVGALVPPIFFWFLIGSGLGSSFRISTALMPTPEGQITYLQFFFPGTIALIVLFTAIFSTISIIEDRHEGFLQSVLVAPVSRGSIVMGKILGGTALAFSQGLIFLCFAPLVGISIHWGPLLFLLLMLMLISFGLTGLGFIIAWQLDSTQGFHSVMNLLLIPMWLLSGALFPISGATPWLRVIMRINPLTYGVAALSQSFIIQGHPLMSEMTSPRMCLEVTLLFGLLMYVTSVISVTKR
jgi:ABC-2 type transport system permease protein